MHTLIADDEPLALKTLAEALTDWGHTVETATDGTAALKLLEQDEARFQLAILDWMMPGITGPKLARRIREKKFKGYIYIILLTARGQTRDIVDGLNSGADDYVSKPFIFEELQARINVGERIITLEKDLARNIANLESAIQQIKQLKGLLPICSYCKRIRADKDYWLEVENYISDNSNARFSHGICPQCMKDLVEPELDKFSPSTE